MNNNPSIPNLSLDQRFSYSEIVKINTTMNVPQGQMLIYTLSSEVNVLYEIFYMQNGATNVVVSFLQLFFFLLDPSHLTSA